MDQALAHIFSLASDPCKNIPKRIRGKVMYLMADVCRATIGTNERCMHVGLDTNSCTSTAAALVHWLCNTDEHGLSLSEIATKYGSMSFAELARLKSVDQPWLAVFNTTNHRFCVLRIRNQAVLLQSNQDDTRGGRRFALHEWIDMKPKRWSLEEMDAFLSDLTYVFDGRIDHAMLIERYFKDVRFGPGIKSDCWFVTIELSSFASWMTRPQGS